ncbi:DUF2325 domain-containing protein [Thermodesulfobacterium sp. TA1]|uniref:DUF2325 domain-containing protein n=1 Tax=Thermodesulfobacterium sp. TA1 TaxID=2234087 RepID=UPI0012319C4D|nr:DUF2325 domain-containing protein [Thermodesulfobacterium sp. TA1]QER41359.1 DUF2325 domain-containing protein [Thermodesulfobacterium sp. TA1]
MTVVVIGGHDRFKSRLEEHAKKQKIKLKFINRFCPCAQDAISSADYVIVITGCVSHELVDIAKRCAKERCIFCQKKGLCKIKEIIRELKISCQENFLKIN